MNTVMIKPKVSVHNFFILELRDAETNELKQKVRAENIVLNSYFSQMAIVTVLPYLTP